MHSFFVVVIGVRGVEQLVARQAHNLEVVRSSRASATNKDECIKMKVLMHSFFVVVIGV